MPGDNYLLSWTKAESKTHAVAIRLMEGGHSMDTVERYFFVAAAMSMLTLIGALTWLELVAF